MEIYLYSFSKSADSTAIPNDSTSHIIVQGEFKTGVALLSPIIEFQKVDVKSYNYLWVSAFNRYYFIQDWIIEKGKQSAVCTEDILGTWRKEIFDSEQYVVRSKDNYDSDIIDNYYPVKSGTETQVQQYDFFTQDSRDKGCFILGIVGKNSEDDTGVCYVALEPIELRALMRFLLSEPTYLQIPTSEISKELTKALFNPIQYIKSAIFLPFKVEGTADNIRLGWWETGISCKRIPIDKKIQNFRSIPIPKHPLAGTRGGYLNASPFTRYTMTFYPFGSLVLDSNALKDTDSISILTSTSVITGDTILKVIKGNLGDSQNNYIITTATANIAVPIAVAQISRNDIGVVQSYASVVGDLMSLNIGKAFTDVGNAIENSQPKADIRNNSGSFSQIQEQLVLCTEFKTPVDEDIQHNGRPLCAVRKLNDLWGYVKCMNANVDCGATMEEKQYINDTLNKGAYME